MNVTTRDLTQIAIFTALLSVASIISIPIGNVPITLQTLVVMLIGLLLSPKNSFLAILAYLLIGIIGVPVFASGKSGFGVILGPTGGFLIAFILGVVILSKMKTVKIINNETANIVLVLIIANVVIYMIGWTYFAINLDYSIGRTLAFMWPFAIADLVKIVVATYAYLNMRSHVTYEHAQI